MRDFRADLHCHTSCSDGALSPIDILHLAKRMELSALSITDHDTVTAYRSAVSLSHELGLILIPGVEFSADCNNVSVHILGYGFDVNDPHLQTFCLAHAKRRKVRNNAILEKLALYAMPLSYEEIERAASCSATNEKTIGRPHIAMAMVKKGYVESIQQAFKLYIGENGPCYVHGALFSASETIELIHQAKGIAVIAHPHLIKNEAVLTALLKLNFDGIECYYGNQILKNNQRWIKIAKSKEWVMTGGSDYHGNNRPDERLGGSWIDEETFLKFAQRLKTRNQQWNF